MHRVPKGHTQAPLEHFHLPVRAIEITELPLSLLFSRKPLTLPWFLILKLFNYFPIRRQARIKRIKTSEPHLSLPLEQSEMNSLLPKIQQNWWNSLVLNFAAEERCWKISNSSSGRRSENILHFNHCKITMTTGFPFPMSAWQEKKAEILGLTSA